MGEGLRGEGEGCYWWERGVLRRGGVGDGGERGGGVEGFVGLKGEFRCV